MHQVCLAQANLLARFVTQQFKALVMPYVLYNDNHSFFQPVANEDGFAFVNHLQSLNLHILQRGSAQGVDEIVVEHTDEMLHAVGYLGINFMSKLKQVLCNNIS